MYSACEIAQWFINKSIFECDNEDSGEYITHLKLQKLLYYAQGCYAAMKKERLFGEEIKNWTHGPVVVEVYEKYRECGNNGIKSRIDTNIDRETVAILEEVYNVFGKFSAWQLRNMTHQEAPWLDTKHSQIIPFERIKTYFEDEIVE